LDYFNLDLIIVSSLVVLIALSRMLFDYKILLFYCDKTVFFK